MIKFKKKDWKDKLTKAEKKEVINFLYSNLQEYRDSASDIEKAVNYALKENHSRGGFILMAYLETELVGVVVINETGMEGYIPENILVYIATHKLHRGKGIGKALLQKTIILTNSNIALHVEQNNPAKILYEKIGFKSKYIEMRYNKDK